MYLAKKEKWAQLQLYLCLKSHKYNGRLIPLEGCAVFRIFVKTLLKKLVLEITSGNETKIQSMLPKALITPLFNDGLFCRF